MITIKNRVRSIAVDEAQLKRNIQKILNEINYPDYDLGILLTTNKTIKKYNKFYRNKNKPTDILSFSYYPDLEPGSRIKPASEEEKNLGDLIISLERTKTDAKQLGIPFKTRLNQLVVHGICHLLGYDHVTEKAYQQMKKKEELLLSFV